MGSAGELVTTRRFNFTAEEHEEIQFPRRLFRRYVYSYPGCDHSKAQFFRGFRKDAERAPSRDASEKSSKHKKGGPPGRLAGQKSLVGPFCVQ